MRSVASLIATSKACEASTFSSGWTPVPSHFRDLRNLETRVAPLPRELIELYGHSQIAPELGADTLDAEQ
jgi:hypothetical protein